MPEWLVDIVKLAFVEHLAPADNPPVDYGFDPLHFLTVQIAPDFLPTAHWQIPPLIFVLPVFLLTHQYLLDSALFFPDGATHSTPNSNDLMHFGDPLRVLFRFLPARQVHG